MVKAKDFWKVLCEDLNYRFFSGVVYSELLPLYKTMDRNIMHYVPAADEITALGLVSGAYISGYKGGVLVNMDFLPDLFRYFRFNEDFKIPLLIIGYAEKNWFNYDFPTMDIKSTDDLIKGAILCEKSNEPSIMVFRKGGLK